MIDHIHNQRWVVRSSHATRTLAICNCYYIVIVIDLFRVSFRVCRSFVVYVLSCAGLVHRWHSFVFAQVSLIDSMPTSRICSVICILPCFTGALFVRLGSQPRIVSGLVGRIGVRPVYLQMNGHLYSQTRGIDCGILPMYRLGAAWKEEERRIICDQILETYLDSRSIAFISNSL